MYGLEGGKPLLFCKLINAASKSVSHMDPVCLSFWESWSNEAGKGNSERNKAKFQEMTCNRLPFFFFWDFSTVLISLSWDNILVPGILYVILYPLVKSWKVSFFVFCGARNTRDKVDRNISSVYAYGFVILLYSWHMRDLFVWQVFILLLLWQVRLCLLKEAITVSPVPTWNGMFGCYSS